MQVKGKITIAEVETGVSRSTGNEWKKCHYVLAYHGHYANGTECVRTLAFNIFGRDRLNQLRILEGVVGTLEFETRGDVKTAQSGSKYETCEIDVLNWTPDAAKAPKPVVAQPKMQVAAQPANAPQPTTAEKSDELPF